jgi:hypothetical protein
MRGEFDFLSVSKEFGPDCLTNWRMQQCGGADKKITGAPPGNYQRGAGAEVGSNV